MDRLQNLYPSVDYECLRQIYISCSRDVEATSISLQTMGFTPVVCCPSASAPPGDAHFSQDIQLALALSVQWGVDPSLGAALPAAGLAMHNHDRSDFHAVRAIAARPADGTTGIPPRVIEAATFRFRHASPTAASPPADDADDADDAAGAPGRACAVCLAALRGGDECRRLPCLHAFHAGCVDGWLARSRLCPVCKADVAAAAIARV
jgi:hypothetical protein